jgi:hypothetical protein
MHTRKVSMTAIEQIQQSFENAPECRVKEVPKVQAIRILIPQIRTMHAKGYDWEAIARLLSEQGVAVTAVTLKSYLHQAKAPAGKRAGQKQKGLQGRQRGLSQRRPDAAGGPTGRAVPRAESHADKVASAAAPPVPAKQSAVESSKAKGRPTEDLSVRRSAFVPEEDSDDL